MKRDAAKAEVSGAAAAPTGEKYQRILDAAVAVIAENGILIRR